MQAELLIHADWVIPVAANDHQRILEHHALAIADGRIVALLPSAEAHTAIEARRTLELPRHVLIPGLVNAHTHAAMALLRGLADDLPLMTWLNEHIWPAERRWADHEFVADGTRLAMLEMLRGGTTCFHDMYFHPEVTARVAAAAGMRAVVGMFVINFPNSYASDADDHITRGLELYDGYRRHPLISTAFAPHAPYTVDDTALRRVKTLADELEVPVHLHLHETHEEIVQSLREHGVRPLERIDRLGLLGPALLAIHMTQLEDAEIERLAETSAHVVHCPESNLKLASGFCPVERLRRAGVNVALGTDGAASNNDLNMLGELRTAALLAKAVAGSASALPAADALRMATLNGARALGLDDEVGSLELGKSADLVAISLEDTLLQPLYNPLSQLVYAADRQMVRQVWVRGQWLIRDGVPTTLDAGAIHAAAGRWEARIAASDHA